jgi:hypothetical protein
MDDLAAIEGEIAKLRALKNDLYHRIGELDAAELRLQTRRNRLSPLCRLPVDIIRLILDIVVHSQHKVPSTSTHEGIHNIYGEPIVWLRLVNVCAHIRSVAIASPNLWSHIDLFKNLNWNSLCISRAGAACLSIIYNDYNQLVDNCTKRYDLLKSLFPQGQHMIIRSRNYDIDTDLQEILRTSAKNLRSLTWIPYSSRRDTHVSHTFLGGNKHSLTNLTLWHVCIKGTAPSLPRLVHLHMNACHIQDDPGLLLDLVQQAPLLNELSLVGILFSDASPKTSHLWNVRLNHLHVLHVEAETAWLRVLIPIFPPVSYKCSFRGSFTDGGSATVTTAEIDLRAETYDCALKALGLVRPDFSAALAPVLHMVDEWVFVTFTYAEPPMDKFYSTDWCSSLDALGPLLPLVKTLHIENDAMLHNVEDLCSNHEDSLIAPERVILQETSEVVMEEIHVRSCLISRGQLAILDFRAIDSEVKDIIIAEQLAETILDSTETGDRPRYQ